MGFRYVCDICNKEAKEHISVGRSNTLFCKKCWMDKKNWEKIHKDAVKNSKY
ncbi:MAG: hypothetical protein UR39_C0002G0118 [Candidatus Woesebacteria bacterium GW2011_GWA1_33_30]|uniref:Uncharacterized protein n=1 Tax=Candidatus Woesebacteria bacterium GW2011_GWA2_33_28 TaxID=1618561 RepID=A0A0G0CA03_9BACT|nr:MAG: hypothetical protein UR38_C0002G0118 [Candidatus Woesebacteria bacterium GW2011_GWA2_33_28]KKP48828.1 MAG: hypothetical protein UR39_C0002G0118 [Candidatus Woesebacteria bacterium GW2011_GWA1_33_30]KKP50101.1 MAG: hypothetical protein UR40_C0002G0118 [Microgenomates group bacterium GW2011_GWC1_33_32]KKP51872.1 MAG: hypothetical protein UR44_C0006G0118 [Candidatus Woesebacteria bacterium GW2011_GWB1_33_38]KKP56820.1 MAG: hypothetical protein UR48_C0028G0013 [Microgenomates group bacteriu